MKNKTFPSPKTSVPFPAPSSCKCFSPFATYLQKTPSVACRHIPLAPTASVQEKKHISWNVCSSRVLPPLQHLWEGNQGKPLQVWCVQLPAAVAGQGGLSSENPGKGKAGFAKWTGKRQKSGV